MLLGAQNFPWKESAFALAGGGIGRFRPFFRDNGPSCSSYYLWPPLGNVIHLDTGFKADFYTSGRDELHAWAFRNARQLNYRGELISVAPPEYVIIRKLEYFREGGSEKHLRDIRAMLAVSETLIDQAQLQEWIRQRGLIRQWEQAQNP